MTLKTPVLFLIFNRPDTTARVFSRIKQAQPARLYISSDGARADKIGEEELVRESRECVKKIDWPCQVKTVFRAQNLGCGKAVAQAIDWFFDSEEEGIILEDDCLPALSFFPFCEQLLHRYRDDEKIMHISGNNFIYPEFKVSDSYYFSKFNHIWGWATWRRAWKHYDFRMKSWSAFRNSPEMLNICAELVERKYWEEIFELIFKSEIPTSWDYQWTYTCWANRGLSILPAVNLVSNIGFAKDALHTADLNSPLANMPTGDISHIKHPLRIVRNEKADSKNFEKVFLGKKRAFTISEALKRISNLLKKVSKKFLSKIR